MCNARTVLRLPVLLCACSLLLCACRGAGEPAVTTGEAPQTTAAVQTVTAGQTTSAETTAGEMTAVQKKPEAQHTSGGAAATAAPAQTAASTAAPAPQAETVTLTVGFQTAVENGILRDPAYAGVLPESGYFLENEAVALETGESALDLLRRTLRARNIAFSASGGYVRSIGGLSERAMGAQSGWLYSVNGVFPNYSARSYTLKPGDRVAFLYSCKLGDVGQVAA